MKRCKFCGAIEHKDGCPNNTCIAYVRPKEQFKSRKTAKSDKDTSDITK